MERDEYKCRITGGTDQLQVHHYPLQFSKMFNTFLSKNSNLNPISDCDELFCLAQDYGPFWDIDNGMTVTGAMHKNLHMHNGIKDEDLIVLHDQGWSCQRISKHFGKSLSFVRSRFLTTGRRREPAGYYNKLRSNISPETQAGVLEAYVRGDVVREICRRHGIASGTLYKILQDNGVVPGNRKKSTESKATQDKERVRTLNESGVTVQELARMYEVSDTTIRNILK